MGSGVVGKCLALDASRLRRMRGLVAAWFAYSGVTFWLAAVAPSLRSALAERLLSQPADRSGFLRFFPTSSPNLSLRRELDMGRRKDVKSDAVGDGLHCTGDPQVKRHPDICWVMDSTLRDRSSTHPLRNSWQGEWKYQLRGQTNHFLVDRQPLRLWVPPVGTLQG